MAYRRAAPAPFVGETEGPMAAVSAAAKKTRLTPLERLNLDLLEKDGGGKGGEDEEEEEGREDAVPAPVLLPFPTPAAPSAAAAATDAKPKGSTSVLKDLNFCPHHGSLLEKRLKAERAAALAAARPKVTF
jgi:hypothetical protein